MIPEYKICSLKFIIIAIVIIFSTLFYLMNIGQASYRDWSELIYKLVLIYSAGNITSKFFKKKERD
jgi:hypothetical protein